MLRAFIIATGLGVGLIGAPSVLAGGWSVTVLDQVLMEPVAGATHRVGFTVLQHGTRPADGLRTSIAIQATGSGQSLEFPAHADGASGTIWPRFAFRPPANGPGSCGKIGSGPRAWAQ